MVASLPVPMHDDLQLLDAVVAERARGKHAEYFKNYREAWRERLGEYEEVKGNPVKLGRSALSKEEAGRFINLYEARNGAQVSVIKALRKNKLLCCPACGEDGAPDTLDHYLPKSVFPEFSIYTKNLVPMCGFCQRMKSSEVLNAFGDRQFLHSYYDVIRDPLYKVKIEPPYHAPSGFLFEVMPEIAEPLRSIAALHAKALDIDLRFQNFCEEKYLHLLKLAALQRESNSTLSKILRDILPIEEMKSINSWSAVFYRSVLIDGDLIDYLENSLLPANM